MVTIKIEDLTENFSWDLYSTMRNNQRMALERIAEENASVILELPPGSGKTEVGHAFLKTLGKKKSGLLFYITITKAQANQFKGWYPEANVVYGRNEYDCLYYEKDKGEKISAEEAPCTLLTCSHRVNLKTGETEESGVEPCPYLLAKYEAQQGGIVVCTVAFYLLTQLFTKEWKKPAGLVIEEAHRMARMVRSCLKWGITDYHLKRNIEILERIDAEEALIIKNFRKKMMRIIRRKKGAVSALLKDREIKSLLDELLKIDSRKLLKKVREAVKQNLIDPVKEAETLKKLETIAYEIPRYIRGFEYSLPTPRRKPLSFTYGYWRKELKPREKVKYRLVIQSYYVAPIIRRIIPPFTIAYSATIGDPKIFGFETGIEAPFYTFPSEFPTENTKIFMPTDTPNLAFKSRRRRDPQKALRKIAENCKRLANLGLRSLVIVVSEWERTRFLFYCQRFEVDYLSYGNGIKPRKAVEEFKKGMGDVLVGTVAVFGEGIDLPNNLAPAIFSVRPAYPVPWEPATEFEQRRFGKSMCWRLWNYRAMIEALQVRGRNIRGPDDKGVTIFISQQFRRFLYAALPEWLQDAYVGDLKLEEAMQETVKLVSTNNLSSM